MSIPYQSAPDQHDTAAFTRPVPPPQADQAGAYGQPGGYGQPGASGQPWGYAQPGGHGQPGGPGGYVPGESVGRSNPEADYWAGKYQRQRRWTRVLAGGATAAVLVAVGLGFAALQSGSSDEVATAGQTQTDATTPDTVTPDGTSPEGTTPEGSTPDGSAPEGTTPEGTTPDGGVTPDTQTPDSGSVPLDSLPLPDSLRSLASTLGITDLNQLVQMGVSMGMISEEDAADLLAAVQGGSALGDLFGSDGQQEPDSGSAPQDGPGQGPGQQGAPDQGGAPQDQSGQGSAPTA